MRNDHFEEIVEYFQMFVAPVISFSGFNHNVLLNQVQSVEISFSKLFIQVGTREFVINPSFNKLTTL